VANLNADLLDGQDGSYYLDYENFTNVETLSVVDEQVGDSTYPFVGGIEVDDHQITVARKSLADVGLSTVYKYRGTKTWAQLLAIDKAEIGDVYSISDKDPEGNINADWACWTAVTSATTATTYQNFWQSLGGKVDLSTYVQGPASATDNALVRYDGATGKKIQNSGIIVDDNDNLTTKGIVKIQNGAASGAFVLGADVNAKTLTANQRKLGRMGVPSYDSTTKTIAGISFDSQQTVNLADFGGHPKNTASIAPDVIRFTVADSHDNTVNGNRTLALQISKQDGLVDSAGGGTSVAAAKFFIPVQTASGIVNTGTISSTEGFVHSGITEANRSKYLLVANGGYKAIDDFALASDVPDVSDFVTKSTAQTITGIKTFVGQSVIKSSAATASADNTVNGFKFLTNTGTYVGKIASNDAGALGFYGKTALYFRPVIGSDGKVDTTYGVTMNNTGLFPGSTKMNLGTNTSSWGSLYATTIYEDGITLSDKYAEKEHTHTVSDITDFPEINDGVLTLESSEGLVEVRTTFSANDSNDVTFSVQHAIPDGAASGEITGSKIVGITTDKFGHITNVTTDIDSDEKVKQSATTTSKWRKIILSSQASEEVNSPVIEDTDWVYTTPNIEAQASTGNIRSSGSITATKHITAGSSNKYVVLGDGSTKAISDFALDTQLPDFDEFVTLSDAQTITGVKTFTTQQNFSVQTGASPFTVTSTTKVANLNADKVDEFDINGYGYKYQSSASISLVRANLVNAEAPIYVKMTTTNAYHSQHVRFKVMGGYDNVSGSTEVTSYCRAQNEFYFDSVYYNGNKLIGVYQPSANTNIYYLKFSKFAGTYASNTKTGTITVYAQVPGITLTMIEEGHADYATISSYSYVPVPSKGIYGSHLWNDMYPAANNSYNLGSSAYK
jgi:hypothetical protein